MDEDRTVVLVGHCGPDMHLLKSAVGSAVPGTRLVIANDARTLAQHADSDHVLLINRVLDGFDEIRGVELIRTLSARPNPPIMMLISNYADAQRDAAAAGARPGFGKSELYAESTKSKLREAIMR